MDLMPDPYWPAPGWPRPATPGGLPRLVTPAGHPAGRRRGSAQRLIQPARPGTGAQAFQHVPHRPQLLVGEQHRIGRRGQCERRPERVTRTLGGQDADVRAVPGQRAESLALALDLRGIAVGTGSACASGAIEPSHVLAAMGRSAGEARSALRFSLGTQNTSDDIDAALEALRELLSR